MHVKYAVLQFSYSAPVRVWAAAPVAADCAAREIIGVALRAADVFARVVTAARDWVAARGDVAAPVRVVTVRGDAVRAVSVRDVVAGVNTAVRAADDARSDLMVVDTRCWVTVPDFVRIVALPSRTAAPAPPRQVIQKAQKIRIFFISDKILAKLRISGQAKYHLVVRIVFVHRIKANNFDFSCCKRNKVNILYQSPADMAELVDALVSGTSGSNALEVRVFLSAPCFGVVAQLIERYVRIVEVVGLSPISSTKINKSRR